MFDTAFNPFGPNVACIFSFRYFNVIFLHLYYVFSVLMTRHVVMMTGTAVLFLLQCAVKTKATAALKVIFVTISLSSVDGP